MPDELTVLDYFKALLTPWRGAPPPIPHLDDEQDEVRDYSIEPDFGTARQESILAEDEILAEPTMWELPRAAAIPWRSIAAITSALAAQISLEPGPDRTWGIGMGLYILSTAFAVWGNIKGEWSLPNFPSVRKRIDDLQVRWIYLAVGGFLSLLAFLTLGGNRFTLINFILWISAILIVALGFWKQDDGTSNSLWKRLVDWNGDQKWSLRVSTWSILLFLSAGIIIFFRFYQFASVPPEMVSDHAEKILDIWDVLNGQLGIFFPRNTGREGFQMYLTAFVIKVFGTGYSFISLKIGTILAGLAALPFIYLLGKEIANKRAALFAVLFAGIAYWPNVISRVGLRFSIYPLFVAPTLYFLIRGIRQSRRNDFILAGLFLGLGLHGYTPFRIVPFVILVAVGLYLIHAQSKGYRKQTILFLLILIVVSLMVFLPLLRYWLENPEMFSYRAFTRLGNIESPLPGPAGLILINNIWNAMTMFFWSNGEIWPVSIPHRPALDVLSAALFFLGMILLAVRYVRKRQWLDIFLILSVPLLMLPSILSLAFPSENPTLNRTAGALVPVFLIIGISLEGFVSGFNLRISGTLNKAVIWAVGLLFFLWAGYQNFDLVFNQYQQNYRQSSWNTSEIGGVIRDFTDSIGQQKNAFVVAYPHWVDTRLVGINAGFPTRDFAIWPEDFSKTLNSPGSKMFIVKIDDLESLAKLREIYPDGIVQRFESFDDNKDFFQFFDLSE